MSQVVVIDFETPDLSYHLPHFRILSIALAWRDSDGALRTSYYEGERAVRRSLQRVIRRGAKVVAHNSSFELGCIFSRFPDLYPHIEWEADTMRLTQVGDNGLPDGLSLQACVKRWLPEHRHNHKERFYQWLRDNGVKKGQEGANLDLLPPELIREYNELDAIITLELYETLTHFFKEIDYDWRLDHELYFSTARLVAESKARGVLVDRAKTVHNISLLHSEISQIERSFRERFSSAIGGVERRLRERRLSKYKTERGRDAAALRGCPGDRFNIGSTQQLAILFQDELGLTPWLFTEKGAPSFAKSDLHQWGEGGKMLEKMGSLEIALQQLEALEELSRDTGRFHIDMKVCGTVTGRLASGSGD